MPSFPPGSGGATAWQLNGTQVWASPNGSDAADGLSAQTPKLTGYAAAKVLTDAAVNGGTGILNLVDGVNWGGPVTGQGMWFRGDGLDVPGFLPKVSMIINMSGKQAPVLFGQPCTGVFNGPVNVDAGGDRFKKAVWIVGGGGAKPIYFQNIATPGFLNVPYCAGVDFERNRDGSLRQVTITNATRTTRSPVSASTTVYTVTLPAGETIVDAKRTSNVVTIRLPWSDGFYMCPNVGSIVRVVTSDANFPSIDAVITGAVADTTHTSDGVALSYTQAGADIGYTAVTGGTASSHCCQAGDRLELASVSSEFPTTMYLVTTATVTTVTVTDIYGYSPRTPSVSVNNPGYFVRYEPARLWYNGDTFQNCTGALQQGGATDRFASGPFMYAGASTAQPLVLDQSQFTGYSWDNHNGSESDLDRGAAVLLDAGVQGAITSMEVYKFSTGEGGIRAYGANGGLNLLVKNFIQDSNSGFPPPNINLFRGSAGSTVLIETLNIADSPNDGTSITQDGTFPIGTIQCKQIFGRASGQMVIDYIQAQENYKNPWALAQWATWQRGLAIPHPGTARAMGPVSSRFNNLVLPVASWNGSSPPTHSTVTGPDGASSATRFVRASFIEIPITTAPLTGLNAGDIICCGAWVNFSSGAEGTGVFFGGFSNPGLVLDNGQGVSNQTNWYQAPGWQWVWTWNKVVNAGNGQWQAEARLNIGTTDIWGATCILIPAGTVDDNDAYEVIGCFKQQPLYLTPGTTGTMEGQGFTGHGGLTVGDSTIDTATLRLNTSPNAAALGATNYAALRWNAGTGKIEYCKPSGAWTTLV